MTNSQKNNLTTPLPSSLSLDACLAKTYGDNQPGRDVLTHCQIVGMVARELMDRMPEWLRDDFFPDGSELIAACHDIGKVNELFQKRICATLNGKKIDSEEEKKQGFHWGVSQVAMEHFLRQQGYAKEVRKYVPVILGQHHGSPPHLTTKNANATIYGSEDWQQVREELIIKLKGSLGVDFPPVESLEQMRILSGLTTVADWIGSGSLFNDPDTKADSNMIKQALDDAGFIRPRFKQNLSFKAIFDFDEKQTQTALFSQANKPGVYILEAPMGLGKTEAALYAAYQLMQRQEYQATGFYFALPTQLTSNKIYERVNAFLDKILEVDSPLRKSMLAHGNAWLMEDTELGEEGNPGRAWFDDKKRRILAPFAVGTIDQALMAVLKVKHGFVRSFGLVGKVVILDEVHTYDMYTGTLLNKLVEQLQTWHCTVIILSATLSKERREALLSEKNITENKAYPLISAKPVQEKLQEFPAEKITDATVQLFLCQQDDDAIYEAVDRAKQGQQVLWIENTVAEAQERFDLLTTKANEMSVKCECGLLHSRFLKVDREAKENYWVNLYGKDNPNARQKTGRILVGTQVLEQSLDIDADFLITRFAPTDMLLQRIGRLWRHEKSYRPDSAKREAWLLAPEFNAAIENAKDAFGKTATVYAPYVLCRSLEVWHKKPEIILPLQIRDLIDATYCPRDENGQMLEYQNKLDKRCEELKSLAQLAQSSSQTADFPESVSTRYSDQDTVQVLLLAKQPRYSEDGSMELTFLNGEKELLPNQRWHKKTDNQQWRKLAAKLIRNTVQVADYLAPKALFTEQFKRCLEEYIYLDDEETLRVAIVDESEEIKSLTGAAVSDDYSLHYSSRYGYRAEKLK